MPSETQTVTSEKFIKASPALVYQAFTSATVLKEWLCDVATVAARPGGRMYLWWNGDFYSAGEYLALEPNHSVSFRWHSKVDPAPTQVTVSLLEKEGGTLVTMAHTLPAGEDWAKIGKGFQHDWTISLDNLASVLETGLDRRIFDRPMLGIGIGEFNADQAKRLGVPVTTGIRLESAREGMVAYAAGLQKDDVMVSLGGAPLSDYDSLVAALRHKKGGDRVEVVFYRGSEKKTATMELGKRPVPDVPFDIPELAHRVRALYDALLADLDTIFSGVSDAEASFHPAPEEWNAKEVLAHLILGFQFSPNYYLSILQGQEFWSDSYGGNSNELHRAVVTAFPTVPELLEELRRLSNLMVAFVASWPAEFLARKSGYFRVAWPMLEEHAHTQGHLAQIQEAIAKARQG
jgi:uncharacterized protein YndB with AHSA1/START domain